MADGTTHTLGFVGDVMLGRLVDDRFSGPGGPAPAAIWGDVGDRLRELDGLVINLECCLSTRGKRWTRTRRPFHFRADPGWAIPALQAADVDVATLANNHVLDFRSPALRDTLSHLQAAAIETTGAGPTVDEALEPAIVSLGDDRRLGVVGFTDNTPEYAADETTPGTAHIEIDVDDDRTRERVRTALDRVADRGADLVVASLHWGPNMVESPPQAHREFARWLIDRGVDVIHGHSAHIFQGVEIYNGRPILYDTGDFVDDYRIDPDLRNDRSFLFELTVGSKSPPDPVALRLTPVEIEDRRVQFADGPAARWARDRMTSLASTFGTEFEEVGPALVYRF